MTSKEKRIPLDGIILSFLIGINVLIIEAGYTTDQKWYWAHAVTIPMLVLAILNKRQK
jgi:hypothetical protein